VGAVAKIGGIMKYIMLVMANIIAIASIIDVVSTTVKLCYQKAWRTIWGKGKRIYLILLLNIMASIFAILYIFGY
jgi:hypothetical protein